MNYVSTLRDWKLKDKRVILRLDLNIPFQQEAIFDDFKIEQSLPTLEYILEQGAIPIVITHLGRPDKADPSLSTGRLVDWFEYRSYGIVYAESIEQADRMSREYPHHIILLENIRFFPEEKKMSLSFAQELASLGDYYVNDAFGAMHRNETSITLLPKLFMPEKATIGFLVEKELKLLNQLLQPGGNAVYILGGTKVKTKLPLLKHLPLNVNQVLLTPALVFTFLQAQGLSTGSSYVEQDYIQDAQAILMKHTSLLQFPRDYQISKESIHGPYHIIEATDFEKNDIGISIGPKTIKEYTNLLEKADKIFFNGAFGFYDIDETMKPMNEVFKFISKSSAFSVIAGGDSTAAFRALPLDNTAHLCTGGGSALTYLAGQKLPGLEVLFNRSDKNQEDTCR